jgi:hypothetical protein
MFPASFHTLKFLLFLIYVVVLFVSARKDKIQSKGFRRFSGFRQAYVLNYIIDVTGDWRKLHNEELHNLYSSPEIIRMIKSRRMRWVKHVARMGETKNAYRMLVGKPKGKRPLRRPRSRWLDNIKIDLREREDRMVRTGSIWLRIGTSGGLL